MFAVSGLRSCKYRYALSLVRENRSLTTRAWELSAYYLNLSASGNYTLARYEFSRYLAAGSGVESNFVDSVRYLKLSADDGLKEAQYDYGLKLSRGMVIAVNEVEAARYFGLASNQQHLRAMYEFGKYLYTGRGVSENREEAVSFFESAASRGLSDAQVVHALYLLDHGKLVEGATLAGIAARRGNLAGMFLYGKCLRDGIGVRQNPEAAGIYLKEAADWGNADAQEALEALSNIEKSLFQNLFTAPVWKIELTSVNMRVLTLLVV
jgi:TPR repeat protein